MTSKTYGRGQILRIDLTTESITKEPIPAEWARKHVGGSGINGWLLWEHFLRVDPRVDPKSPENVIIAGIGPLGATGYGAGTKMKWTFKSPFTGFFGDSVSGGFFGPNLRWAGYDHVVITGRASHPVYVWIHDDDVQIRDARRLWGMDVHQTDHALKEGLGYADAETALIGPAGENGVAFAGLQVSTHRGAGRTGAGCLFGSKNLKALVARGTKGIAIHDPQRFLQLSDLLIDKANAVRNRDAWKNLGTMSVFSYYNRVGVIPYRNNQWSSIPREKADLLSGRWYLDNIATAAVCCSPGCISGCGGSYRIKGNESPAAKEFAGETGYRMELASQVGFGGMCDIPDFPAAGHLWKMCCEYGMDAIELSVTCAFLMELWERGIITAQDTAEWLGEPITLEWGNYRAVARIIESVAFQNNRLGALIKDGAYQAAQRIEQLKGVPVRQYAVYGKGGMTHISDIRVNPSWATAFAVASRGTDHLKGAVATLERFARPDISMQEYGRPEAAEQYTPTLKGPDTARAENRVALVNMLGLCTFIVALDSMLYPAQVFADAVEAATGVAMSPEELILAGERTVNLEKAFNSRLGLRREDDRLCHRWMEEPLLETPAKGMKISDFLEQTKDEYYEAHGWDRETSLQTREKLDALGLAEVAEVLAREGALAASGVPSR